MPTPVNSDLLGLDYQYLGEPFAEVALDNVDVDTLDINYLGVPFTSNGPDGPGIYVKIGGQWKKVWQVYFRINGSWKTVNDVQMKSSGTWKII